MQGQLNMNPSQIIRARFQWLDAMDQYLDDIESRGVNMFSEYCTNTVLENAADAYLE
jgi:hypothetical protein